MGAMSRSFFFGVGFGDFWYCGNLSSAVAPSLLSGVAAHGDRLGSADASRRVL